MESHGEAARSAAVAIARATRCVRVGMDCALVAAVLLSTRCASYVDRMAAVKADLRAGNVDAALARLDERFKGNDDDLVYLMERGLLLRYAGRWEESNSTFERAEQRAEDLYTRSVSQNLASLLTSDTILPYEGEDFERVVINYYRALNYLDLGDIEGALVECRKVQRKLRSYEEHHGEGKKYRTDPFIHYLAGAIQESAGELNDAYISYKNAVQGFQEHGSTLGVSLPSAVVDDLLAATERLSFLDEVDYLRRRFPTARARTPLPPGFGEAIVLVEVGYVPAKAEVTLSVPILETEKHESPATLAGKLRDRARERRSWRRVHYWLKMALPAYPPVAPPPWKNVEVDGEEASLVENFDALARISLEDRMPRLLLKTIARALSKYLATTKGEDAVAKRHGEAAGSAIGAILNLAAVATERADLRAWLGLPREIYLGRVRVPAGGSTLVVQLRGHTGAIVAQDVVRVRVQEGRTVIVAHRFFV